MQKRKWFEESCKDENTLIEYYCTNSGCQEEEKYAPPVIVVVMGHAER